MRWALPLAASLVFATPAWAARPPAIGRIQPEVIYHNYCSVCHGDKGDGRSRARGSLVPPPRDFTTGTPLSREAMVVIVREGKAGTAMTAWKSQLSDKEIAAVVDYIRASFMQVALDPRVARGRSLYGHNCVGCHGDRGQGVALPGTGMHRPPRDLASPAAQRELTRSRMIDAVRQHGPAGTPMATFGAQLADADAEAVVDYMRVALMSTQSQGISGTLAHGGRDRDAGAPAPKADMSLPLPKGLKGDARRGEGFYLANCATCHGAKGDGQGPRAYFIRPVPRNFLEADARARLNRPVLYEAIAMGRLGTEMPAWSKVLTEQEMGDLAEFVFQRYIQPPKAARSRAGK
jgi:mono/diheme cytochrome c family protein